MWISRLDLKKIAEVFEQFPDSEFFTLTQDNHAGIGSVTTMTIPHTIAGQDGEFTVEISGTENY